MRPSLLSGKVASGWPRPGLFKMVRPGRADSSGPRRGDLAALGGQVRIRGQVDGDALVLVEGTVGGGVMVRGGEVAVLPTAVVRSGWGSLP